MTTPQAVARITPRINYRVAPPAAAPVTKSVALQFHTHIAAVKAAVAQCRVRTGGWRRKDLLRGRASGLASLFALFDEMKDHGAALSDLEGVNLTIYNANRAVILAGVAPLANESLSDALHREAETEGMENVSTIEVLAHPTPGNLMKLRQRFVASIEAQRHVVDVIDAMLLKPEDER